MPKNILNYLALLGVISLICLLAYGSQIFFHYIEPQPLHTRQTIIFNSLVGCIWVTYLRACFTDAGWVPRTDLTQATSPKEYPASRHRWCRTCERLKPPRAHHCKICKRCIPKMDHHCPWTANCVSNCTFPHFFRFLLYAVVSMTYLEYFLCIRAAVVWNGRSLPSYMGPTAGQLIFLFVFLTVNSVTLLALAVLLARNIWCLGANVTTIEGWEIERHDTLVRRARKTGGYLNGPDGTTIRLQKQEFPYDVGIYKNIRQGMGSSPLFWLWPFALTPSNESGLEFTTNGFEDSSVSWPPPDPDRIHRSERPSFHDSVSIRDNTEMESDSDRLNSFRQRQLLDQKRFDTKQSTGIRRRTFHESEADCDQPAGFYDQNPPGPADAMEYSRKGWRDSEGDRLDDFGVDEDAEFCSEDDISLAELLRRKKAKSGSS